MLWWGRIKWPAAIDYGPELFQNVNTTKIPKSCSHSSWLWLSYWPWLCWRCSYSSAATSVNAATSVERAREVGTGKTAAETQEKDRATNQYKDPAEPEVNSFISFIFHTVKCICDKDTFWTMGKHHIYFIKQQHRFIRTFLNLLIYKWLHELNFHRHVHMNSPTTLIKLNRVFHVVIDTLII